MSELSGEKILLTGPAGQIALPIARELAKNNEVWGLARFGNPEDRKRVEKLGLRTLRVDLASPDWSGVPDDFTIVGATGADVGVPSQHLRTIIDDDDPPLVSFATPTVVAAESETVAEKSRSESSAFEW